MTDSKDIQQQKTGPTLAQCRMLLQESPVLWPLVAQFQFDFVALADRERVKGAIAPLAPEMMAAANPARQRLAKYVLGKLGVMPCFHLFPKDDGSRVLLLKSAQIMEIAEWLGALAYEPCLRRTIQGAMVKQLEKAMPGCYPKVFRRAYYYGDWSGQLQASTQMAKPEPVSQPGIIKKHGLKLLASILGGLPPPLVHRLMLRFPESMEQCFQKDDSPQFRAWNSSGNPAALKLLFNIIANECPDGWKICSC